MNKLGKTKSEFTVDKFFESSFVHKDQTINSLTHNHPTDLSAGGVQIFWQLLSHKNNLSPLFTATIMTTATNLSYKVKNTGGVQK